LHVSDLEAAIAFYTKVLGCTEDFRWEDFYAGLLLGSVHFHIAKGSGPFNRPVGGANLYFCLDSPADVDACYAEIVAKGGRVDKEPQDYPYGMRDFVAFDLDGNMLSFGADTES
jgi:catechol 2,3-dioxygenase-like lactoylglutathione lyase family enzyme